MRTALSSASKNAGYFTPLLALFFISGFAALVYQVLWVRELGLLIGSTAQSAALTIAIFFAGISAGGWFWGRRARRSASALAGFGWLEIGVAGAALGHFILVDLYHVVYPALFSRVAHAPAADTLLKSIIAVTILFPPSFLMGGTLPFMGEHLVRYPSELGRRGSLLYLLNTAGGAAGALAAGFYLPIRFGFQNTYLLAIGLDLLVGLSALLLARRLRDVPRPNQRAHRNELPKEGAGLAFLPVKTRVVWAAAFVSGFVALGVEVIWTRLFSQVLQNSVYTYALVLVAFLFALALGAALANGLCRVRGAHAERVLLVLLLLSALVVAMSPWLFHKTTGGLGYVGAGKDWAAYIRSVGLVAFMVMLVPGAIMGAVLPYLLRLLQDDHRSAGDAIGRLIAINTAGAILGSLCGGFLLLPLLGATRGLFMLASLYLLTATLLLLARIQARSRVMALPVLACAALLAWSPADRLPVVALNTSRQERLIAYKEGSHATAAVIERDQHLLIRVNNHYTLGGTGALESQRNQALIPLLLHPAPRDVFFLGMGTGIMAGAALLFPVEQIVVCEILPEVISLSRRHFAQWTEGLFADPRATILAEDGRNQLRRSTTRYDVIIADLFTPWKAGTGNLYTLEHFQTASRRLKPGGLFVQWIPTYQVSEKEFGIIARTMDEVFEQVVLWRGDLYPAQSIVALVGQNEAAPLAPEVPIANGRLLAGNPDLPDDVLAAVALRFYAGNITASGLFRDYPINRDNRPLIEYIAPRTQRRVQAGQARWLTGDQLGILYERLVRAPGFDVDPYLARLTDAQRGYVLAGRSYFNYGIYRMAGRRDQAQLFLDDFIARTPFTQAPPEPEAPQTLSNWEERELR